jgi:hypothetical protein
VRVFILSHLVLSAIAVVLAQIWGGGFGISAACGAGTSLLNTALLGFTWSRIMAKKQVALAIVIIVFKFALFGWILYLVAHSESIHIGWFSIGLGMVIPSSIITALFKR